MCNFIIISKDSYKRSRDKLLYYHYYEILYPSWNVFWNTFSKNSRETWINDLCCNSRNSSSHISSTLPCVGLESPRDINEYNRILLHNIDFYLKKKPKAFNNRSFHTKRPILSLFPILWKVWNIWFLLHMPKKLTGSAYIIEFVISISVRISY